MDNNQNNNFSGSSYNNNQYNYNNDNQNTSGTWSSSGNAQNSWSANAGANMNGANMGGGMNRSETETPEERTQKRRLWRKTCKMCCDRAGIRTGRRQCICRNQLRSRQTDRKQYHTDGERKRTGGRRDYALKAVRKGQLRKRRSRYDRYLKYSNFSIGCFRNCFGSNAVHRCDHQYE